MGKFLRSCAGSRRVRGRGGRGGAPGGRGGAGQNDNPGIHRAIAALPRRSHAVPSAEHGVRSGHGDADRAVSEIHGDLHGGRSRRRRQPHHLHGWASARSRQPQVLSGRFARPLGRQHAGHRNHQFLAGLPWIQHRDLQDDGTHPPRGRQQSAPRNHLRRSEDVDQAVDRSHRDGQDRRLTAT